jgi:hypothetical protein
MIRPRLRHARGQDVRRIGDRGGVELCASERAADLAVRDDAHAAADAARRRAARSNGGRGDERRVGGVRAARVPVLAVRPVPGGMLAGSPLEEVQRVRNHGQHGLEPLSHASGASRQIEHEGSADAAGDGPGERGERRRPQSGGPHQLR